MGERASFDPGAFCWADLPVPNVVSATSFYTGLFGWEAEGMPARENGTYTVMRVRGKDVCALYAGAEGQRAAWLSYVSVSGVDDAASKLRALGGTVVEPPSDVLHLGRMALVQDPEGAELALWEPRQLHGATLVNDPGSIVWNQLSAAEVEPAKRFYGELFGWTFEPLEGDDQPAWEIFNVGRLNGGVGQQPDPGVPPSWQVLFSIDDIEAAIQRVVELGGGVLVPPSPMPAGRFAVVHDPDDASFGLYEGEVDP